MLTSDIAYDKLVEVINQQKVVVYWLKREDETLMRVLVTLACGECKRRNYTTAKNKKNDPGRIEMKKYCRYCHIHTLHKETR